jgi:autotransporter-associated beta strand protein
MQKLPARLLFSLTCAGLLAGALNANAQAITKAATGTDLTAGASWTGGNAPGSGNVAAWASTSLGAGLTMGSSQSWLGISAPNALTAIAVTGGGTLTLGTSGIDMSAAVQNLTWSTPISLGGAQTWNVASGKTLAIAGSTLNAGANALTITGAGTESIAAATAITATGGFTKNGSGALTITGQAAPTTSITTFTVNGGVTTISSGGAANSLNSSANIVVGGGTFNYQFNSAVNQAVANLTINAGEGGVVASRNGSFNQGLTLSGTITRNLGGTIYSKLLDSGRGFTIYNNLAASTTAKDANGTPYMTTGDAYSGATTDIYNDWGGVNSGHQVVVATYNNVASATALATPNPNAQTGFATVTLAADTTTTAYRDANNNLATIDLNGHKWTDGGILITTAKATAGSIIKDTPGTGMLMGPSTTANSDIVMMIDASLTAPKSFTISAIIGNNTTGGFSTAVTKGAPGTLILSGNNTFTGGVFLNDGTLQLGNSGALNSSTPNAVNFDGNGLIGIQATGLGPNPVAPVLALAGNSVAVASLSTANNLSGVVPVIENANGSSVPNATLTINGSATTTFTGIVQDGPSSGTLSLIENGSGSQTLGGTLSYSGSTKVTAGTLALTATPSATAGYTVNGILDVSALSSSTLPLTAAQSLTGSGTVNGTLTTVSGTTLAPGSGTATTGGTGATTVNNNLTLAAGTIVNFGLVSGTPKNSQIIVGSSGTLTLPASGTVTINLYTPGSSTAFATAGTYNLFQYTTGANVTSLASRFTIGTSITGFVPTFGTASGPGGTTYLTLTLTVSTGVVAAWTDGNSATDNNWSDALNWSGGVPHAAGDAATFGNVVSPVVLDTAETVGTLAFNQSSSYTISGSSTLTLDNSGVGASVTVSAGTANLINPPIALNDSTVVSLSGASKLTLAGVIANSGATAEPLTITGTGSAGTAVLSTANTYGPAAGTTGTTLSGGVTVQAGNSTALSTGDVNITGNSTLQSGAANLNLANNIAVGGGVTATVDNNGNNLTLGGVIGGGGSLAKISAGTLTLGSANTYGGNTAINAGTLSISADGSFGTAPGSATPNSIVLNGGDLLATGNATLNANRGVGIGATSGSTPGTALIDAASGQTLTVNGTIASAGNSGADNLTVNSLASSPGTVMLGGANTFSGNTVISAGTLQLANSLALQNSVLNYSSGSLTFGSGITAATIGQFTGSQSLSLNNQAVTPAGVTLTIGGNNATWSYGGSFSGLGSLIKVGTGTLTLTGNNSYSGTTTCNAGALALPAGGVINGGAVFGQGILVNGGSLTSTGTSTLNAAGNAFSETSGTVSLGDVNEPNAANDGLLISLTGGSFSATSVGLGRTVSVTTAPTATAPQSAATGGGFYVNGASASISGALTLGVGANGANSSADARVDGGSLSVGGKVTIGDTSNTRWNILQVNGGTFTSSDTVNGLVIAQNYLTTANSSELFISGGTASATKISFGISSDTLVNTGWIIVTNGSLYIGSGGIVLGHATDVANISLLNGLLGATANWSSSLGMQLSGTGFTIQAADSGGTAHNITLSGVLSGAGGLTNTGSGTLTLNSSGNTYSGLTTINGGTLNINSEWALGGANYSGLTFNNNGTLQYASTLLNSTTDISTKPVTFTGNGAVDVNGHAITFANPIGNSGPGGLTLTSSLANGTLMLSGANTYAGVTTVNSGTLLVTGSTGAGGLTVSNSTVGGTGTIGGAATNLANAVLAPGIGGIGTLTFGGALTLSPASTNTFAVTTSGGASDKVVVTGLLTASNSVVRVTSGTALLPSTNILFTYGTVSGTLNPSVVFDVAPVHPALLVDNGSGQISLVIPDNPPVAGTASYTRNAGISLHISITNLLANATDAYGDTLSLVGVTTSTNGVTLVNSSGNLLYQNASNVNDQFTYTVTDPYGATSTGLVNIVVNNAGTFGQNATVSVGGSSATVSFAAIPGYSYGIQRSTNLTDWVTILTTNAPSNGLFSFTDNFSDLGVVPSSAYYRLEYNP